MVTMTLMPTYITIDERMRLGYCTPLVEVGPGVWHHLLFGDVVETVYDPRWWFFGPGGLRRLPNGGAIGGYFAPGQGPPEMVNCLGDPATISGPLYYDDYGPGWWWRGGWRRGRRWRRGRHGGGVNPPHLSPPTSRTSTSSSSLGPPILRSPTLRLSAPSGSGAPSSPPMSFVSHPNAARTAQIRRDVEAWLQPQRAMTTLAPTPMRYAGRPSTYATTSMRQAYHATPSYSRAAPMRPATQYYASPSYSHAAPMRSTTAYHAAPSYARAAPMRSGGGFRPAPLTHAMRGLGAFLARALGR